MENISENKFFFAVKALIFCGDKFLIIKRSEKARGDSLLWDFPGGRLEFSEKPLEALKREIFEETGIKNIEILYPINLWEFLKNTQTQVIGATYLCKTKENEVYLSEEHSDYAWISKNEISGYNICEGIVNDMSKWNWDKIYSDLEIKIDDFLSDVVIKKGKKIYKKILLK